MLKEIIEKVEQFFEEGKREIEEIKDDELLEKWRIKFLGRKSYLNKLFSQISSFSNEEKVIFGKKLNQIKQKLIELYEKTKSEIKKEEIKYNVFLPGKKIKIGNLHPITKIIDEIVQIFYKIGFAIAEGPEIETDYYNFTALNTPEEHPARDIWDTFYIEKERNILLRTHTSPVQIRIMEKYPPPLRIIAPGKCFRRDSFDSSHSPMFHQIEGLMVDRDIKFTHLKGILTYFIYEFFKREVRVVFSPSYFPFTEPSAEVSISCVICEGKGCSTCGNTGFLEILGCGMVHPNVFKNVGYNNKIYTGFAFGMGVERLAMLKYQIDDIRHFYYNDLRFLEQF
ncbi:MAG: phenylalanine--tRNA ligase subunit alpha [Candidatus Omnitrophica bacterium]|nr:phenylalanine--tRNA ligase subunit alpha [Candidatus Omnitrophota bacterium]MCM8811295.1 phenylalanine--tRNA ligase subunit alpha [Candidatus Omnitrophota bacterium]